jgi:protoporphyrin/coproporphyrin ferrochelatase
MSETIGLLVMAYGTASGPDDIERYYTDIRGGRPPSAEQLAELTERYAAIGNRFPLLDLTRRQADGLARELGARGLGEVRPYLGMKHSPPFIPDAVRAMRDDGIGRAVGIVMAPHWSGMSVETYIERVEKELADHGRPALIFVRQWYEAIVGYLADRVSEALETLDESERRGADVIFTAHSLPVRTLGDGTQRCLRCAESACADGCVYRRQLERTADLVSSRLGPSSHRVAWQSAGRTPDPWWGPAVEDVIRDAASNGYPAVCVCSAGFVADHLEILYDLDIEARAVAEEAGIRFVRTQMPNADPRFLSAVADAVQPHLARS